MNKGGNPNDPPQEQHQPKKTCPICGVETKGLPFHIAGEH